MSCLVVKTHTCCNHFKSYTSYPRNSKPGHHRAELSIEASSRLKRLQHVPCSHARTHASEQAESRPWARTCTHKSNLRTDQPVIREGSCASVFFRATDMHTHTGTHTEDCRGESQARAQQQQRQGNLATGPGMYAVACNVMYVYMYHVCNFMYGRPGDAGLAMPCHAQRKALDTCRDHGAVRDAALAPHPLAALADASAPALKLGHPQAWSPCPHPTNTLHATKTYWDTTQHQRR